MAEFSYPRDARRVGQGTAYCDHCGDSFKADPLGPILRHERNCDGGFGGGTPDTGQQRLTEVPR